MIFRQAKEVTALLVVATIASSAILFVIGGIAGVEWPQRDKVNWQDEMLGAQLKQEYSVSLSGKGEVRPSSTSAEGGWMELVAPTGTKSSARIRLGDDPVTGEFELLHWSAKKNLIAKARIRLNSDIAIHATVGFIGRNDPDNTIAAIFRPRGEAGDTGWILQTARDKKTSNLKGSTTASTDIVTIELRTTSSSATLYINDTQVARSKENIPTNGLAWEFQLWNLEDEDGWSDARMYVDYLTISQDR